MMIIDQADEKLFQSDLTNPNHVLSSLLLPDHHYYLRARCDDRKLVDKRNKLFGDYFIIYMLYTDSYWLCISCVLTTFNKNDENNDNDDFTRSFTGPYWPRSGFAVSDDGYHRRGKRWGSRARATQTDRGEAIRPTLVLCSGVFIFFQFGAGESNQSNIVW